MILFLLLFLPLSVCSGLGGECWERWTHQERPRIGQVTEDDYFKVHPQLGVYRTIKLPGHR